MSFWVVIIGSCTLMIVMPLAFYLASRSKRRPVIKRQPIGRGAHRPSSSGRK